MIARILDADGNVVNTVVATEEWLNATFPGRWEYAGDEPAPTPEPSNPDGDGPFLSNYAFDMRYTLPERIAIKRLADQRNPDGSYTDTALAVQVNVERAQKAKFVNPQRAETRNGVMQFVALGVLTQARALEILDTPIQPFEAYTP